MLWCSFISTTQALLNKAWTQALFAGTNFWYGLKPFNLSRLLEYETLDMFSKQEDTKANINLVELKFA